MTPTLRQRFARRTFLHALNSLQHGQLTLLTDQGELRFGDPASTLQALVQIHNDRFFERVVFGGDEGTGEAYVDGDWSTPDLVSVVRLAIGNLQVFESGRVASLASRCVNRLRHLLNRNTREGSRRNIEAHYDLSNELFSLFLDRRMVYSSAVYPSASASLEEAQFEKLDRLCRKLRLQPGDRVLEIGTGWGAFALHAARHYGCSVTTTTISSQQYKYAARLIARHGDLAGRIQLLELDYRDLPARLKPQSFDKIVSIEMFEAVGLAFYDDFFRICDQMLTPDGMMAMQTITMNERRFPAYIQSSDWIRQHIFPGGELASVREIQASLQRATGLSLVHLEDIGLHYAHTLSEWRRRFHLNLDQVRRMDFDNRFVRTWDYYLAYCEGAFRERYIGTVQLVLSKCAATQPHYQEPWNVAADAESRTSRTISVRRSQ